MYLKSPNSQTSPTSSSSSTTTTTKRTTQSTTTDDSEWIPGQDTTVDNAVATDGNTQTDTDTTMTPVTPDNPEGKIKRADIF